MSSAPRDTVSRNGRRIALLRAGGQHDCVGAGDNHLMAD